MAENPNINRKAHRVHYRFGNNTLNQNIAQLFIHSKFIEEEDLLTHPPTL